MSNVINRATLQYLVSVNTPDYPVEQWIINPNLGALSNVDKRYWKIIGDEVLEMTAQEKAPIDAAQLVLDKASKLHSLNAQTRAHIEETYSPEEQTTILQIYTQAIAQGRTNRAAACVSIYNWVRGVLTYRYTTAASIRNAASNAELLLITWDVANNTGAVPTTTIPQLLAIAN